MLHSQHICFTNETNANQKTIVAVCSDLPIHEDNDKKKLNETKMLLNIIGKHLFNSTIFF